MSQYQTPVHIFDEICLPNTDPSPFSSLKLFLLWRYRASKLGQGREVGRGGATQKKSGYLFSGMMVRTVTRKPLGFFFWGGWGVLLCVSALTDACREASRSVQGVEHTLQFYYLNLWCRELSVVRRVHARKTYHLRTRMYDGRCSTLQNIKHHVSTLLALAVEREAQQAKNLSETLLCHCTAAICLHIAKIYSYTPAGCRLSCFTKTTSYVDNGRRNKMPHKNMFTMNNALLFFVFFFYRSPT